MLTPVEVARQLLASRNVPLKTIADETGMSERILQMVLKGSRDNAQTRTVTAIARYFGYRFDPVPLSSPQAPILPAKAPEREAPAG